jgi:hypothetical protein
MNFRSHFGQTCSLLSFRSVRSQKTHGWRVGCPVVPPNEREPTQPTQPKGIDPTTGKPYEPVEIPVPKRSTFDKLLGRAEKRPAKQSPND